MTTTITAPSTEVTVRIKKIAGDAEQDGQADSIGRQLDTMALGTALVRALLSPAPRNLLAVEAELIMFQGQYLLHYTDGGSDRYKFLTPGALRSAFAGQPVDSGWLSPGVVRWGEGTVGKYAVLWVPPQLHNLTIDMAVEDEDEEEEDTARPQRRGRGRRRATETLAPNKTSIKAVHSEVPLPGIVMLGIGRTYYLWAVTTQVFEPKALAYYPPLPNIYGSGAVCWGSNSVGAASEGVEKAWALFVGTPFNDHLAGGRSRQFPNDVRVSLFRHSADDEVSYDLKDLVPFKREYGSQLTIEQAIDALLKGTR